MVTPQRRSAISMVLRLCVMRMNCVCRCMPRSISTKRPMLASSSGASISSSRQNGLGLYLKMREHQRDRRQRLLAARQQLHALQALAGRLRDDLDAALERIVLVEQRQAGAAAAEQRAERLLEVAVDRARTPRAKRCARRLVDPLDRLARSARSSRRDPCAASSGTTWRVSSSSNCSIAIMLTGPRRSILRAQRRNRLLGAEGAFGRLRRRAAPASIEPSASRSRRHVLPRRSRRPTRRRR